MFERENTIDILAGLPGSRGCWEPNTVKNEAKFYQKRPNLIFVGLWTPPPGRLLEKIKMTQAHISKLIIVTAKKYILYCDWKKKLDNCVLLLRIFLM